MTTIFPQSSHTWFEHDLLRRVTQFLHDQQQEAYLVGGAVRDGLLGNIHQCNDLDLVVPSNACEIAKKLANHFQVPFFAIDIQRDVGRVILPDTYIDVAAFRPGTQSLIEDLQARDFTINAIAFRLDEQNPELIDPTNGMADLESSIIRHTNELAIMDDFLRAVRAIRFAVKFQFDIDADTCEFIDDVYTFRYISPERLRDELHKLLQLSNPKRVFKLLNELNLLPLLFPEVVAMIGVEQSPPHHLDVFEHTMLVMTNWQQHGMLHVHCFDFLNPLKLQLHDYFSTKLAGEVSRYSLMAWVALLHDVGKPQTFQHDENGRIRFFNHENIGKDIAHKMIKKMRFSDKAKQFITTIVQLHMRPLQLSNEKKVTRRAIYRFLEASKDTAPAIAIFSLMDSLGTYPESAIFCGERNGFRTPTEEESASRCEWEKLTHVVLTICQKYFEPKPPPLLTGRDIIEVFGMEPSPQIGTILKAVREAQILEEINSKEEAINWIIHRVEGEQ